VDFMDVAAAGADTEEKGALGKRVLGAFRTVDALLHVVRCFQHPYLGEPRPQADLESLELELIISDLTVIENTLERNRKMPAEARHYLEALAAPLRDGRKAEEALWRDIPQAARQMVSSMALLVAKPGIVCANISEQALGQEEAHHSVQEVKRWAQVVRREFFWVCASIESEIAQLSVDEAGEFMRDLGIRQSGLDKIIRASYRSLNLMTFFTVGEDECRAWTVCEGATAPQAAGKVHTDLQRGFIRAEVVTCEEFLHLGSMAACRDKGVLRLEGKQYVVQDGDIVTVRFNV